MSLATLLAPNVASAFTAVFRSIAVVMLNAATRALWPPVRSLKATLPASLRMRIGVLTHRIASMWLSLFRSASGTARGCVKSGHRGAGLNDGAHPDFDDPLVMTLREKARGGGAIGTTGRGIGPAYEDKVARRGIRVRDLLDGDRLRRRVKDRLGDALDEISRLARLAKADEPLMDVEAIVSEYLVLGNRLREFVGEASLFLAEHVRKGTRILFEGAQGTLLDVDHGTYPYVTSSNTVAGNAAVGSGLGPTAIDKVLGITKAYTTRVGGGPFPTELSDATGDRLRKVGDEYGATTGRPRRCGWLDTVVLRYSARVNGMWGLALTKMDILSGLETLKVCTAYELDGQRVTELPGDIEEFSRVQPIYEELQGWEQTLAGARTFDDLPPAAQRYVRRIEEIVGVPVVCVSVGAERGETILLQNPFRS